MERTIIVKKKNNSVNKYTCSDCVHRWACAAWNIGSIANMNVTNCANFEKFSVNTVQVVRCGECKNCTQGMTPYDMHCEKLEQTCYTIGFCGYGEKMTTQKESEVDK